MVVILTLLYGARCWPIKNYQVQRMRDEGCRNNDVFWCVAIRD